MLLAALLAVSSTAWADFWLKGKTVFFDNSSAGWNDVYIIIGKGNWSQAVKLSDNGDNIYTHSESGWNDATAFFFADNTCGAATGGGSGTGIDALTRTANCTANITSDPGSNKYLCTLNSRTGTSIGVTWSDSKSAFSLGGKTLYYDNSVTQFSNVYLGVGHNTWREADSKTTGGNEFEKVPGTHHLYRWKVKDGDWTSALGWLVSAQRVAGGSGKLTDLQSISDGTYPYLIPRGEEFSSSYVYKGLSTTQTWGSKDLHEMLKYEYEDNFEITYSAPSNGTLTVKDYDNNNVTSGSNKCILTVLKITATPADGYVVGSAMVGGVDYTAQAREGTFEHTVTASTAVSVTFVSNPTVLIAEDESVSGDNVTLNGHIQFTRCYAVTEYGFVYGTSANPTTSNHKEVVGTAAIAGTHYTKTFSVESNATYHYRAYMIAGGATYYSAEDRTFEIDASCNATSKSIIEPRINGSTTASALVNESVSLSGTVHADVYLWTCKTKPDGATVTFGNSANRNTTVSVNKSGTYTFTLKANCTSGTVYESDPVTLYVCAPPSTPQTLYLDNHEDNIICVGETSTATIISETGYTYNLYRGDDFIGSYTGTGATLTWRNVEGVGTFYIKTTPAGTPNCAVTFASATQAYNAPVVNITATPGTSVLASKDVVLTKDGSSIIDTNLKWEITQNHDGYLLYKSDNVIDNRKEYAGRERESVYFKGGVVDNAATTYKVTGTGTRTVNIPGGSGEKKTCEASSTVTITVSPATESCTP